MCGRFVRYSSIHDIVKEFNAEEPGFDLPSSYNIAPSQDIAVVLNDGKKRLALCKWGYIPSWSKDPAIGNKMINARAESVADKPSFKNAFKSKRVLVAADGFYEWQKAGKTRIPVYIYLKTGKPFGFAGLLSVWTSPEGKQIYTCTIITTDANKLLEPIHDRMPVIIYKEDEDLWLDQASHDRDKLTPLLRPYEPEEMDYYAVSTLVNSPSHDSPDCIKRVQVKRGDL
jgi:putative SOS response-associated peptidase YedK